MECIPNKTKSPITKHFGRHTLVGMYSDWNLFKTLYKPDRPFAKIIPYIYFNRRNEIVNVVVKNVIAVVNAFIAPQVADLILLELSQALTGNMSANEIVNESLVGNVKRQSVNLSESLNMNESMTRIRRRNVSFPHKV